MAKAPNRDFSKRPLSPDDFNQMVPGILYLEKDGKNVPYANTIDRDDPNFIKGVIVQLKRSSS